MAKGEKKAARIDGDERSGTAAGAQPVRAATKTSKAVGKKANGKKATAKKANGKKLAAKNLQAGKATAKRMRAPAPPPPLAVGSSAAVLDRLWAVVDSRRGADPTVSHSARLLARGTAKVAQKFGEEAVECLIEAVGRNRAGVVAESADVLYHLIVLWVDAGVRADEVWTELHRREGVSGIAEKAARARSLPRRLGLGTTKIP